MTDIQVTRLDSGLRIITDSVPEMHSAAVGLWVDAGTRDETMEHNGAAHMVEHMLFKGTPTRTAQDIAETIENVGGHMNAYTSREVTSYHAHTLKEHAPLAMDILCDMVQHSTMPDNEIERERQVILQEIGMCHDNPDDLVFDNYFETAWPNQTLGAPILGTAEIIENISKQALQAYVENLYTPERIVVSASGNIQHDALVEQVSKILADLPDTPNKEHMAASYKGGENRFEKELEQSHIVLGFQAPGRLNKDFYATRILATILGGGMSSRLFQEVREKRGLVYAVYSFYSGYADDGVFGIYAGTGPERLPELIPVLCEEIKKLGDSITVQELDRAKSQLKAGLLMGRESMMSRADQNAKHMIYHDKPLNADDIISCIDRVDQAALSRIAGKIFTTAPTLSALGPLGTLESYDGLQKRLS